MAGGPVVVIGGVDFGVVKAAWLAAVRLGWL
jgi:hypothetical protein